MVNCQVYKGNMYKDPNIINAVNETRNLILVDENMDFITASYFSNSGGQTNNVEDVLEQSTSIFKIYSRSLFNGWCELFLGKNYF